MQLQLYSALVVCKHVFEIQGDPPPPPPKKKKKNETHEYINKFSRIQAYSLHFQF